MKYSLVLKNYSKVLFFFFLPVLVWSQTSKDLESEAVKFHKMGDFQQSALLWEKLFNEKGKSNFAFEAAENFYLQRDYRKAAIFYLKIKYDFYKYDNLIYKYAKCLKQDEQYNGAIKAFHSFLKNYVGNDKALWEEMVAVEIKGCNLAMKLSESFMDQIQLFRPKSLNTAKDEFSVTSFDEDYLYYSSKANGKATILASSRKENVWEKGIIPASFPLIPNGQVSNGSFSNDGTRFYFTICSNKGLLDDRLTRCEIYRMKKIGASWSQPIRLPDEINLAGFTATHPHVVSKNGREILYFVSDRPAGRGGMDIWFVSRDASSDDSAYLPPVNAGPGINTQNDEFSPFYHSKSNTLYFSSNGFPSLGGLDIFSSSGTMTHWGEVKNLGLPFNSAADDLHYCLLQNEKSGWLTSNRVFENEKLSTTDSDVFYFELKNAVLKLLLEVLDFDGRTLPNFSLKMFEDVNENNLPTFSRDYLNTNQVSIDVLPNRDYSIRVQASGFITEEKKVNISDIQDGKLKMYFKLQKEQKTAAEVKKEVNITPEIPKELNVEKTTLKESASNQFYRAKGISPYDNAEYETNSPLLPGQSYKIQLEATDKVQMAKYNRLVNLGTVHTELLTEKKLYRVLIGPFQDISESKNVKMACIKSGFKGAFIVKYVEGIRVGMTSL